MTLLAVFASLLAVVLIFNSMISAAMADQTGITVVVTFSSLKGDIEKVLCGGNVYGIIPQNIDPHEYQLRPSDIELISRADLIISTGHTHFESKIKMLVETGSVRAKLIDVMELKGLVLSLNPVTLQPNYHLPIRDPINYLIFLYNVTSVLAELDPKNAECYYRRFLEISSSVYEKVLAYRGKFNGLAIIDAPHIQYVVEWLGFKVVWTVKPEEGGNIPPDTIRALRDLIRYKCVVVAFTTWPSSSPESRVLVELAREFNLPVVEVPGPESSVSVYDTLLLVTSGVSAINFVPCSNYSRDISRNNYFGLELAVAVLSFISGLVAGTAISKWRGTR